MKDSFRSMLERRANDLSVRLLKKSELGELSDFQHGDVVDRTPVDRDLALELSAKIRNEIKACLQALERLDAGTYGICLVCGEQIPEKRLRVLPFAAKCVECESLSAHAISGQYAPVRLSA